MAIKPVKKLINNTARTLVRYQTGEIYTTKTARPQLDNTLTGLLPGDIVVIGGASGSGKTFELQTIRENIMNVDINPMADRYVFLDYSFEMKLFNTVLRGLNRHLNKPKKDILLKEFDEKEKALATRYLDTLRDDRFFIEESPCTPEDFLNSARAFLEEHRDKERVVIAIDHLAIFKNQPGKGKKETIDAVVEGINLLKREFENPIFILLTQLNRGILGRIRDNDINAGPNRSDLYQSDTIFHIADYIVVVQNAHRLGISEYLRVNPALYPYLQQHMTEPKGASRKVSFFTLGKIFYHVLKVREGEVIFDDLFIEEIELENAALFAEDNIDVIDEDFDDLGDLDFDDDDDV